MTPRWLTCVVGVSVMLSSGCGCQSRKIESGEGAAGPGGTPPSGAGTTPGAGAAGPVIPGGSGAVADGPAIPAGDVVDPTPKSYVTVLEALAPPLERETLGDLAAELDAKLDRNAKDPVALCARATVAARQALHALREAKAQPDLSQMKALLSRAETAAGDGQWTYLVEHQRASQARLEGRAQDAVEHLKTAIKLQPGFVLGHVEYLQMMLLGGKFADAEAKLQTLSKQWPGEWQVWLTLSRCYQAQKKHSPAQGALEEALRLRPDMLLLHEAMLQNDSRAFQQKKDEDSEQAVRDRFDVIEKTAEGHFKHEANLTKYKRSIDAMRMQFERSRAALLVVDFSHLPPERRTREHILGRLTRADLRRGMLRGVAAGITGGEPEAATARACFLLEVIRDDESAAVRVDAVRGFHLNLGLRAPRPWKSGQRKAIAPLCEDALAVFVETLDPDKERTVRLPIYHALGALPASAISCGPELVARVSVLVPEAIDLLVLLPGDVARKDARRARAKEARRQKKDGVELSEADVAAAAAQRVQDEKDIAEERARADRLGLLIEELEILSIALREIRGLGSPNIGRWSMPEQIKVWLGNWSAWATGVETQRTAEQWVRPEKCK